ncbi:DUF3293 domain-containing protein [Rhodopila sp.]|uniref:DUF3293 domain-containing protein n=1 Tax=Rhodopila sp. TaxID=2480087 RepID=UPI003D1008DE
MHAIFPLAYRQSRYEAAGAVVRIGCRSVAMDRLLSVHRSRTGTFVTAFNPFSRRMPLGWNRRMQARLEQTARRWPALAAKGSWRGWCEAHLLLFGNWRPAIRLARSFRQNAVVIIHLRQSGRLVSTS